MPVSGLILTLSSNAETAQIAMDRCREDPRIEVGELVGSHRCPITLTTESQDEDKTLWQSLQEDPGIDFVDVVCVYFDDEERADDAPVHVPASDPGGTVAMAD